MVLVLVIVLVVMLVMLVMLLMLLVVLVVVMLVAVVVLLLVIAFEPTGRQASGCRYQWSAVAISSRGLEHKKVILIQSPTVALVNPN